MPIAARPLAPGLLLGAFLLLSACYAFTVAPGNAPDEREHVEYVLYLSSHHALPVWNWPADRTTWQARQPPLYYLLETAVLQPFRSSPPLWGLRAMRLFSALLHLAAVFLVWRAARALYGDGWMSLGPPLLLAALPMFTFIGATVNNDAAANLAGAALLCLLVHAAAHKKPLSAWTVGFVGGIALLCKATMLPVIAVTLFALLPSPVHGRGVGGESARKLALAVGLIAVLAAWFYLRNALLYGDAMGVGARFAQYDPDRYAWSQLSTWWAILFSSFWGRFGQMTQPMSLAAYAEAALLTVAALAGWIRDWDRLSRLPVRRLLLAALALTLLQNFIVGFFMSYQPQARLSFTALAAWAILSWDGLHATYERFPASSRTRLAWIAAALLVFLNVDAFTHL